MFEKPRVNTRSSVSPPKLRAFTQTLAVYILVEIFKCGSHILFLYTLAECPKCCIPSQVDPDAPPDAPIHVGRSLISRLSVRKIVTRPPDDFNVFSLSFSTDVTYGLGRLYTEAFFGAGHGDDRVHVDPGASELTN
jgi:hypothetical protein